ncbi:hypothetical protein BU23DRAFT_591161 [Bimuria novae-zelandiae CBS 107.79]|uniref:ORC6 first cyclin-like domain-containing protein n=1 Tax=Bimuria novae-zelandiae CBS 107.79 TaxID=1447943 RepID=A0A6A5VAG2_9PLEO|nr:hypothetical protein BU23DRAFT_591161 [Bimuria novae-zelandiae CBS 107.79]
MSKATTEQALTGLIPTLSGPLPPELVDLALSLLARSRSVAQSLKPDEEIARPYACAQLACERLKKRLNLPAIIPRPPCPPRIYKKLYNYLESALPLSTATREPQTPRKGDRSAPTSARTTPKTPKTPLIARPTPKSTRRDGGKDLEPPEWVVPTVRTLLRAFEYPNAAGHIYTGLEVILPLLARMSAAAAETPSKRPRRATAVPQPDLSEVSQSHILGLISVIMFYVLSRMLDQEITPERFLAWRAKAITTLLETDAGKEVSEAELGAEIDTLVPMAQEEGWIRMDWFLNVLPPSTEDMEGVEMTGGAPAAVASGSRSLREGGSSYIGLGTMMQDATDYLGERQHEDYKRWKASILARVEAIEASS